MKIAYIYDPIYPYVKGGGEKRNWDFACALSKRGEDVYLVGMKYWDGGSRIVKNNVSLIGICKETKLYSKKGKRRIFEAVYFGIFVFFHLMRNNYDVVDCGNFPYLSCFSAWAALFLKKRLNSKTKFIVTWYEVWGKEYWKEYAGALWPLGWAIECIVAKISKYNICISEFTKKRIRKILKVREDYLKVIYNSVKMNKNIKKNKINQIIYVGRLIEHKQVSLLIDAFKSLKNDPKIDNNFILKIVGNGPEKEKLKRMVKENNLENKIIFIDFMERDMLETEISKSKLFVLPSKREGFGLVLIESMALGTPVMAYDGENSAASTIIDNNKNGLVFRNVEDLYEKMKKLLAEEEFYERIVESGIRESNEYDIETKIIPGLLEYYYNSK